MRKIFNITAFLAVVLFAAGCRDTGYDVTEIPTFEIVGADVNYSASGGEGSIEIELLKSGTPTITVEKEWCTATLSGNTVKIAVQPNTESFSRETALTIDMKGYTRTFGIFQNGIYFYPDEEFGQLGYKKDDQLRIPLTRDGMMDLQVDTCSNWVAAHVDGNELIIRSLADNDLAPRNGFVTLKAGVQKKTVNFTQTEYPLNYSAFLGNWTFTSYGAVNNVNYSEIDVVIEPHEIDKSLKMTGLTYPVILTYNEGQLKLSMDQVVGTYFDGTNNVNVNPRLVTASSSTATKTHYVYSTYEIIDSKLVLTLHTFNSTSSTDYPGFGFYFIKTGSSSGTQIGIKYYRDIIMYKK